MASVTIITETIGMRRVANNRRWDWDAGESKLVNALQFRSEYAKSANIDRGGPPSGDRWRVLYASSFTAPHTPILTDSIRNAMPKGALADVEMIQEGPGFSLSPEDSSVHHLVGVVILEHSEILVVPRDTGCGIGALYENPVELPAIDPNVFLSVVGEALDDDSLDDEG